MAKNNSWNNGDRHKIYEKFLINCFRYNSSLTNSTQSGNDSNYSKFNGENITTNCSMVTVLASDSLTRNTLATTLSWKFFPSDHQAMFVILLTANFKFCNRCTCSKGPMKRAGKVCGIPKSWNDLGDKSTKLNEKISTQKCRMEPFICIVPK